MSKYFQEYLLKDKDLGVIDLGANIGYYTMISASMGHKVVAVEPLPNNYRRLAKAVQLERLEHLVTVVTDAVSDSRGNASLILSGNNQGNTRIRPYVRKHCQFFCTPRVSTVTLDDIAAACNFTQAIMKIDVQGFEHRAFSHSRHLLDTVRVTYIFMEWSLMAKFKNDIVNDPRNGDDPLKYLDDVDVLIIEEMIAYLLARGYLPFSLHSDGETLLKEAEWHAWPFDVVWHLAPSFLDRCRLLRYRFLNWTPF